MFVLDVSVIVPRNVLFSIEVETFFGGSKKIERQYMNMCS
jgi:hypothetical protein